MHGLAVPLGVQLAPATHWNPQTFGIVRPHTPVVFGGGGVVLQSLLVQQPAMGMHAALHILKLLAQGKLQVLADPQTPVVFAGPPVQSALVQHPALGMHRFVPAQRLKVLAQAMPQVPEAPPVHVAEPLAGGVAQETQVGPQKLVLVSD